MILHLGPVLAGPVAETRDVDAVEHDLTAGRFVQPNHRVSKRRLAAARLANNGKGLSRPTCSETFSTACTVAPAPTGKCLQRSRTSTRRASAHESYSTSSNGAGSERPASTRSRSRTQATPGYTARSGSRRCRRPNHVRQPSGDSPRNIVSDLGDDPHVVGDDQHRRRGLLPQVAHQAEDLRLDGHIERRGGSSAISTVSDHTTTPLRS